LCNSNQNYITLQEFSTFLKETQKYEWSDQRILETYKKFANQELNCDIDHFSAFLLSSRNSVLKKGPFLSKKLDYPISDYFINSSHNTYLLSDQIVGDSSIEGYIRAILKGCRCLEIGMNELF
jgi:phosphatidylinositol phospholipase C delta